MSQETLSIDGAMGEGGGQIVRMAVALSAVTGKAVEISRIRAGRPVPGLAGQHCAAVQAVARMCHGRVTGCEKGSTRLSFHPEEVRKADIVIDIGTAGSISLVLQAWIPVALRTGGVLTVTGGTEVQHSPTIDYQEQVFLPVLRTSGAVIGMEILERGYYPRGGGRVRVRVNPSGLLPITVDLTPEPGERDSAQEALPRCGICSCSSNLPEHVAERQARRAKEVLDTELATDCILRIDRRSGVSTGSSCTAWKGAKGGSALGERGVPAETVGERAARELIQAIRNPGVADVHLTDQLLLYLALYGGTITTSAVTTHAMTMCRLLGRFGFDISCTGTGMVTFSA
ncbi:MAG: RNA 3'-terminal phosphate cyclase [Methanoregulaceae archaeon]|nr:RNA 3'-terminal phosphate cyclase [Methanoregulaceae archaeon]